MFEKILVATDFSDSSRSVWFAAINLAARSLARVEILNVYTYMQYVFSPQHYTVPDEHWQHKIMEEMEKQYPKHLYPNSGRNLLVKASILEGILEFSEQQACDLIVVGKHSHRALRRVLLGSVTHELIRSSSVPVMVIRAVKDPAEHLQNYNRILVPFDFSKMSLNSLNYGIHLANFLQADIHLIHVVDVPAIGELTQMYPLPEVMISRVSDLNVDLSLSKTIEGKNIVGSWKVATLFGDPAEEILKYAKNEKCGFIVMGTHGRKGFERTLLGSVTASVVSKSEIPVLTISPMKYQ